MFIIIVDYGNDLIYKGSDYICEFVFFLVYLLLMIENGLMEISNGFVVIGVIIVDNFGL